MITCKSHSYCADFLPLKCRLEPLAGAVMGQQPRVSCQNCRIIVPPPLLLRPTHNPFDPLTQQLQDEPRVIAANEDLNHGNPGQAAGFSLVAAPVKQVSAKNRF